MVQLLNGGQEGRLLLLPGAAPTWGPRQRGQEGHPAGGAQAVGKPGHPAHSCVANPCCPQFPSHQALGSTLKALLLDCRATGLFPQLQLYPQQASRATKTGCPSDWVFLFHGGLTQSSSLSGPLGNASGAIVQRDASEPCFPRGPGEGCVLRSTLGEPGVRSMRGCGGH